MNEDNDKPKITEKDLTNLVRGFGMPSGKELEKKVEQSIEKEKEQSQEMENDPTGLKRLYRENEQNRNQERGR